MKTIFYLHYLLIATNIFYDLIFILKLLYNYLFFM